MEIQSASTMESASTSAYQPKCKRRRKSEKLAPSSLLLSTQEEPEHVVEAMDVSGPVEASEGSSSCPPVSEPAEECASCRAFMNKRRVLNNTVLELRAKLNHKREQLKRVKMKLKGRSYLMATYVDLRYTSLFNFYSCSHFEFAPNMKYCHKIQC